MINSYFCIFAKIAFAKTGKTKTEQKKIKTMKKIKQFFHWLWKKAKNFWPWYKNLYKGRPWYIKTLIGFVSFIVAFILYLGAVDINLFWLFGKSPGYFSGIMDPQTSRASEIYSADGKLIGK